MTCRTSAGVGLLASQLGNVIMSSVPPTRTNEAGGLQGTAQNLGASLGTALLGAVLLGVMVDGFTGRVSENPAIPASVASTIATQTRAKGLEVVSVQQAQGLAVQAGLPADQASEVADDYGEAQLQGLRYALFAGAILAVLAFWFTRHLPDTPLAPEPSRRRTRPEEVRGAAPRSAEQHTR